MQLTPQDRSRFAEGGHVDLSQLLGAHPISTSDGQAAVWFAVWAPSATQVTVVGDWNGWDRDADPLHPDDSGIWHGTLTGAHVGARYKFRVVNQTLGFDADKADPVAFQTEEAPNTASVIADLTYEWSDESWMANRADANAHDAPISIYEMHLGSWRYEPGGYRAIAHQLADYLQETGFTHVELLPVAEHPFYPSWGYQTLGYFAPTARFGPPADFKYLVDHLHGCGFGVLLDWGPSHFPEDTHGLAQFDGTHLYDHADPRMGFHPDWKSCIFNYDRPEVRSFLMSSAMFWLDEYHLDGIRVDAVASMLYRDYSRADGEWIPNEFGGNENLGAVGFLRQLNESVYNRHSDVQMIAEESTSWPGVSRPTDTGGLGFGMKWDMGWMHDTLQYFAREPVYRMHHHEKLTFRMVYSFTENFVLPLSHDEVVHGKGSMVNKMPGDRWQQLANLRALYGWQWGMPGKKLLFMGSEFAVSDEWNHEQELRWDLLQFDEHRGIKDLVADLNQLMKGHPALHTNDFDPSGFAWTVGDDRAQSVFAFERRSSAGSPILVVANFTPVPRSDYRIGVSANGAWRELLNTDAHVYGGSGVTNDGRLLTDDVTSHEHPASMQITVPPLAVAFFGPD